MAQAEAPEVNPGEEGEKTVEKKKKKKKSCFKCKNPYVFFLALLMCSEWGDRSQISAIALAPNYGVGSVILGGCVAHIGTIVVALALGKIVERICCERLVNLLGGILFIGFGIWELFFGILFTDYFEED